MIKLKNEHEIVMVDDSDADLHLARRCLFHSKVKNRFVALTSAEDLFSYLDEVKERKLVLPALVLLDLHLPVIDGHEALQKIRSDACFKDLPLVAMLTHSSNKRDIDRSLSNGASSYMVKPLSLADYIAFFDSLLD